MGAETIIGAKTITSRGTVDPAKIIYGTALVAGTLAYRNAHGIPYAHCNCQGCNAWRQLGKIFDEEWVKYAHTSGV